MALGPERTDLGVQSLHLRRRGCALSFVLPNAVDDPRGDGRCDHAEQSDPAEHASESDDAALGGRGVAVAVADGGRAPPERVSNW